MRTKGLMVLGAACLGIMTFRATSRDLVAQNGTALSGVVSSKDEGKMEGVVVSARRDGGTSTVSVVSNKDGRYTFPRTHLEPGAYKITVRAAGFELTAPATATVAAGSTAAADLTLDKAKDLTNHLTSIEWINSMNGTPEEKDRVVHQLLGCNYCHTYQRIMKSKHDAAQFMTVIDRMVKYYADGTAVSNDNRRGKAARIQEPGRVQFLEQSPNWGASPGMPRTEVADFFAKNNLSGGRTALPYTLQALPRPTGAATNVIITEWDIPKAQTSTHDSALDKNGVLWFTDESTQYLGRFDTKTAAFKEYTMPAIPAGVIPGTRDVITDDNGNVWFPLRNDKGESMLTRFDPKTEQTMVVEGVSAQFITKGPDGKIWTGWRRVDPKTMMADGTFSPQGQNGPAPRGAAAYAGNSEVDSRGNPWEVTQQGPGGVMGFKVAENKGVWYPIDGVAGRRGTIDSMDRLWFGEYRTDKVFMFDTRSEKSQRWDLPRYSGPYTSSTPDPKGRVYAPSNMAERLYRVDPKTNEVIAYLWPTEFDTKKITQVQGPNGPVLWFTNMRTARVSRVEILD
ncbi:MAG TPA: carboxypeptidase regulatory-like domain-containing protein [Vicinamibacterales bacterium]|nr:carboxypeptidase regulatory-like domain-containing protein [Vicinamibacterales bacterium]